jgi:hypothetical protein
MEETRCHTADVRYGITNYKCNEDIVLYCIYFPPFLLHSNTWIRDINYKSTSI